jgi:tRNA(fMet)-specific endonuclease VapC
VAVTDILLDTNAYSAYRRGDADAVHVVATIDRIVVNTVVLGELFAGFAGGGRHAKNVADLHLFLSSARAQIVSIDHAAAEQYATVFAALKAAGTPIPTNDMWIAASALQHGLPIFTFDAHFGNVRGLRIVRTVGDLAGP